MIEAYYIKTLSEKAGLDQEVIQEAVQYVILDKMRPNGRSYSIVEVATDMTNLIGLAMEEKYPEPISSEEDIYQIVLSALSKLNHAWKPRSK